MRFPIPCRAVIAVSCCAGCALDHATADNQARWEEARLVPRVAEATEVAEPSGALTRPTALALALQHNPALAAFAWDVRAADARRVQAGALPNPVAEIEFEEFGGDRHGGSDMESTIALSQEVELGGRRAASMRAAAHERDRAGFRYERMRREVMRATARAFAETLAAQRRVELAQEAAKIAQNVSEAIAKSFAAGAVPQLDAVAARMEAAAAQSECAAAAHALERARVGLAAMWGKSAASFARVEGELDVELRVPPLERLRGRLAENPELLSAGKGVDAQAAQVDVERARRIPAVTLQAGYRRIERERVDTFVAGIAVPLPLFDRNTGGIREAEARLARAEWERRASAAELDASLRRAYSTLLALAQERQTYRKELLPGSQATFDATTEGYKQRTLGYLELLTAREKLSKVRREYVDVLERCAAAVSEIEYLTGEPLGEPEDKTAK